MKNRVIKKLIFIAITIIVLLLLSNALHACTFRMEKIIGSDFGIGVGARSIAMGGVYIPNDIDLTATFWNPAGLAGIKNTAITASLDLPRQVETIRNNKNAELSQPLTTNFASFVLKNPDIKLWDKPITLGLSYLKRAELYIPDISQLEDMDFPFYDRLNPDNKYGGYFYSNTIDFRLSAATYLNSSKQTLIGTSANFVFCETNHEWDTGKRAIRAASPMIDVGIIHYIKPHLILSLKMGQLVSDLATHRWQEENGVKEDLGTKTEVMHHDFIYGLLFKPSEKIWVGLNFQHLFGRIPYMGNVDLQVGRIGAEYQFNENWAGRAGVVIPFKMHSDHTGDLLGKVDQPVKIFTVSTGFGYKTDQWIYDFAFYIDPALTYFSNRLSLASVFSLTYRFGNDCGCD